MDLVCVHLTRIKIVAATMKSDTFNRSVVPPCLESCSSVTRCRPQAPSTPASSQLDATPFTPAGKDECRTLME